MNILINQFFGLGDIIFCMTIARKWIAEGHNITWPVLPQFMEGLQRAYPDIKFVDWRSMNVDYEKKYEHDWGTYRVIPLRWNVEIMGVPYTQCMASKYSMFGLDYNDWKEHAMWERNEKRERSLAYLLGIDLNKPYRLINRYFGSNSQYQVNIMPNSGFEMRSIEGYSLFDYAMIIENAEYINVSNSSILYLLELLGLKAKQITLYARHPIEKGFKNTEYLHTKNYNLVV